MPTELALLSDIALTPELMADAALTVIPGGAGISFRDGEITQFVDQDGDPVATVFDPVPVHEASEAAAQLLEPPASFSLWTEITIPFASPAPSRALVDALARSVGGVVKEKL